MSGAYLILFIIMLVICVGSLLNRHKQKELMRKQKEDYFNSDDFRVQKKRIREIIAIHNEIVDYAREISMNNQFVSTDHTGEYTHLADYKNTSYHNYKRNRNARTRGSRYVRPSSLHIVRRASEQPIKYLCKYFGITATEEHLNEIEAIGENLSRLENAMENLEDLKARISETFNPPDFIIDHYRDELMDRLGVKIPDCNIEYTQYIFEYVSPGGNSSQRTVIEFNLETVDAVSAYLSRKLTGKQRKKTQRALMTNALRKRIKERDNYTCQICGASAHEHDLLLLEIDHIIPISKGGTTKPSNLQTLCWRCNRLKSDRIIRITNGRARKT